MVKLNARISGAVILLFLVSTFAVILYLPSTSTSSSTTSTSNLVQFSGDGQSTANVTGFMSNFFILCTPYQANNLTSLNVTTIQNSIENFAVAINSSVSNSSNLSSSNLTYSTGLVEPFDSVVDLSPDSFEASLSATNGTMAVNQYNQSNLFFMLEAQLSPYCSAQVIPVALLSINSPVVFQSNVTNSTPSNYTLYPLDFQGYANLLANQNGGPDSVRALVSRNVQVNSTIPFQANAQVINSTLAYLQIQETGLGQNSISPSIPNPFTALVNVQSVSNQDYLAVIPIPWQYRYSLSSSLSNSLNKSANFKIYNYSYYPVDSILLNYSSTPNATLNLSGLNSELLSLNLSQANQVAPYEWLLSFSNTTNSTFVNQILSNYSISNNSIVFANSTMEFNFQLNSNSTLSEAQSIISATVAINAPLSVYNQASVSFPDVQSVSLAQQFLFPQNFTAYLNESKIINNQANVTIQAIAYSDSASIINAVGN